MELGIIKIELCKGIIPSGKHHTLDSCAALQIGGIFIGILTGVTVWLVIFKSVDHHGLVFFVQFTDGGGLLLHRLRLRRCIFYFIRKIRQLLIPLQHREVPLNKEPLTFLHVKDRRALIVKTVLLHVLVNIVHLLSGNKVPGNLFSFLQGLVFRHFVKTVYYAMVDHHLISGSHALGIAVDFLHGQPFRLFREKVVYPSHFLDMRVYTFLPQVCVLPVPSAKEIFAASFHLA